MRDGENKSPISLKVARFLKTTGNHYLFFGSLSLRYLANSRLEQYQASSIKLNGEGLKFTRRNGPQGELVRVFTPHYGLCRECAAPCCRDLITNNLPYGSHDYLYYGLTFDSEIMKFLTKPLVTGELTLKDLIRFFLSSPPFSLIKRLVRMLVAQSQSTSPEPPVSKNNPSYSCPALQADGCKIPFNLRPIDCLLFACDRMRDAMTWREYGTYWWSAVRLLTFYAREMMINSDRQRNAWK